MSGAKVKLFRGREVGDREKSVGVPISPLCDREKDVNVPKSQVRTRHGRTRACAYLSATATVAAVSETETETRDPRHTERACMT